MLRRPSLLILCLCAWLGGCAAERSAVVPILMYHHINDLSTTADEVMRTWSVSNQQFSDQMHWLHEHGYHSITLGQLSDALTAGTALPPKPVIITFDDGWDIGYGIAFPILKKEGFIGTFFVYPGGIGEHPGSGYMTWDQLREMAAAGMDVESHTIGHPHLRSMPKDAQWREIAESKAVLEQRLDRPVTAFAYPFGEYDQGLIELVQRAGYRCAVGIEPGYTQRTSDLYRLHRLRISYGDTLDTFKEQVAGP